MSQRSAVASRRPQTGWLHAELECCGPAFAILSRMSVADAAQPPAETPPASRRLLFGGLALVGVTGALLVSLLSHNPATLPGVALGSSALLYVEKAAACFTAYLLALVVVVRAFEGDLPAEIRGLKYTVRETKVEAAQGIRDLADVDEGLRERIDAIEALLNIPEPE